MTLRLASLLISAAVVMVGCAGDTDDATDEADATSMKFYDCSGNQGFDTLSRMEIGLSARKLEITDLSKDAAPPDDGTLDPSYRPTPAFAGSIRFLGFPKIMDGFSSDVAHMEMIVSPELKAKQATGKLFMRTSGSGGDSTAYFCRAKPAKMRVDPARKARLACSLSRLICDDDNPPGSTCLGDMFVNQTTGEEATMKLTFMEHFGVHIQERKVSLGPSAKLTRNAKSVDASWADGTGLELEHRGGVTYVGQYTHADGRSEGVQCNDLAMFD